MKNAPMPEQSPEQPRIVITGSCGRLGRVLLQKFTEAGYRCSGIDSSANVEFKSDGDFLHRKADLTDYGETISALNGSDIVVHLANVSYPGFLPDQTTYSNNVVMNYNVFSAASVLGCRRVIWLSSANVTGIDTDVAAPERFPISEDQSPRPASAYALSKSVSESTAAYFGRSSETSFVGIRSTLIVYPEDYGQLRRDADDSDIRRWHYWSYIDVRDLTELVLLAAQAENTDTAIVNATAADTTLKQWTEAHCAKYFPDVPCDIPAGTVDSLFSGVKAAQFFGFEPKHTWRT